MTEIFRDSIKRRLRFLLIASSSFALVVAGSVILVNNLFTFLNVFEKEIRTVSEVSNQSLGKALATNDPVAGNLALSSFRIHSFITQSIVLNRDNQVFATYHREGMDIKDIPEMPNKSSFYQDGYYHHFSDIKAEGGIVGTLYLLANVSRLRDLIIRSIVVIISVLFFCITIVIFLSERLQYVISEPILRLAILANRISLHKDFSLRAEIEHNDEVGILSKCFNTMLDEIQHRDSELKEATAQATSASEAKTNFLSNMSHEIRTPMNAVLGYAQILESDKGLTADQLDYLRIIIRSGNHLLDIINSILDIAKIESGKMEIYKRNFDLVELIHDISLLIQAKCMEKNLTWSLESSLPESVMVSGDSTKIKQILINLLGNSIKFTDSGTITLKVEKNYSQYLFEVIDTGPGIEKSKQEEIFKPFQQEKSGFEKGGTGLGLALATTFTKLMGGQLKLESTVGQGTKFYFVLDLPPAIATQGSLLSPKYNQLKLVSDSSVQALVVDDIAENREILTYTLEKIGINVEVAENGVDALEKIKNSSPNIIFLDVQMPVMDGTEAVQHIKKDPRSKDFKCIAVSGYSLEHEKERYFQLGFDDFISKPYQFDQIYEVISTQLPVEFTSTTNKKNSSTNNKPNLIDFHPSVLTLPKKLHDRLKEAVLHCDITEVEHSIDEIEALGSEGQAFAIPLRKLMNDFDFDGIDDILAKFEAENLR